MSEKTNLSVDAALHLRDELQRLRARNAVLEEMVDAMRTIAFMGGDCPPGMPPESFYRGQFYDCVSTAANALDRINRA